METADFYATKLLKPEVHRDLVANIEHWADKASIEPRWIAEPLSKTCGPDEVDYITKHRELLHLEKLFGLVLTGKRQDLDVSTRFSAMAGCLLRNFVNARVSTINQLIEEADSGQATRVRFLLIPNFYMGKGMGGTVSSWHVNDLLDILSQRITNGLLTAVYVSDMKALASDYGVAFANLFRSHYRIVNVAT